MHRVVKAHLDGFQSRYDVSNDETKQFEAFVNYAVYRSVCAENVDPKDLVYEGDDPGLDGIMIFVDDSYVASVEEVTEAFTQRKRDAEVLIVFTQAKTSETWAKSEINTFQSAINDFLSDMPAYPQSDYVISQREIFNAVLRNVGKIRDGKPSAHCFFATTGRASTDREIVAAQKALQTSVLNMGYFRNVITTLADRDYVVQLWTAAEGQVEATLPVLGMAAFLKAPGIAEGYVVTARAKDFIAKILIDKNGKLRQRIFEENVRDFIGLDAEINTEMSNTIRDKIKQQRFGILNNGITIISPDVKVLGLEMFIRDFQIVNGCQTSNILFEHRKNVGDDTTLMLKVVETSDATVIDDIVRSTNRQAKVEEHQFLATLDAVKGLERYFNVRGADEDYRLYFERRKNQYSSTEHAKAVRVFDVKEIARCVSAMFLDKPEIASRYPNQLTGELKASVFDKNYCEEVYYVAAYTLYRVKLLISNTRIDARYSKLRWYIIMAIKYFVCGPDIPALNSRKIKSVCASIENFISGSGDETVNAIKTLCFEIVDVEEITRDKLKGSSLVFEVKAKALATRASAAPKSKPKVAALPRRKATSRK